MRSESSTVPFEQIGQSEMKRLWRQKRDTCGETIRRMRAAIVSDLHLGTAVPAVGSMCPYVKSGVGAVSTQSWVNPYLAIEALERMERGEPGPAALQAALVDQLAQLTDQPIAELIEKRARRYRSIGAFAS